MIDFKPRYFIERKEVQIIVEYLMNSDDDIHKAIAEEIINKQITSISISSQSPKNENIDYWPKLFCYINKDLITSLYLYIKFNDAIYEFKNLIALGIYLSKNQEIDINQFKYLETITITGYSDNFKDKNLSSRIKSIYFWKFKNNSFNYELNINKVEKLTFMHYSTLDLRNIRAKNLYSLTIDKTKNWIFNIDLLKNLKYLNLCGCDTSNINNNVLKHLSELEELWLERCDLSFIDEHTFKIFPKLKVLIIDKCKNLKTIKGTNKIERFVISNTKVE